LLPHFFNLDWFLLKLLRGSKKKHPLWLKHNNAFFCFVFADNQQIRAQLDAASRPGLTDITLAWRQLDHRDAPPQQAPAQLSALFYGKPAKLNNLF
jgi:hypothetical protein